MRPFGRGVAADNPPVTTVESEILTPAGRRWVERVQRPLDVLAVIFLIDVILIWSFPDAPPAFLQTLNVIVLFVWACFAVDYVARLMLSAQKGRFVRTHKLDLLMVLLPMLRLLRVVLLLRRSLASVSTERIAGSIVSLVVAVTQLTFAFGPALLGALRQVGGSYAMPLVACLGMQAVAAIIVVAPRLGVARSRS